MGRPSKVWNQSDIKAIEDICVLGAGSGTRFSIWVDSSIHPYSLDSRHLDEMKEIKAIARKYGILVLSSNGASMKMDRHHAWKAVTRYEKLPGAIPASPTNSGSGTHSGS